MSREDKSAVLQAMKKMKRANRDVDDMEQNQNSGSKGFRNDEEDGGIADSIINAVSNFRKNR